MGAFLEVTTYSGLCPNNCKFCPRELFVKSYGNKEKFLSLDNFIIAIDKLPKRSIITFSGFTEPTINQELSSMILYAYQQGHDVQICTALNALKISQYKLIKSVKFLHFGIHLPDSEGKSQILITQQYKQLLKYIVDNPPLNLVFSHHAGDIHENIKDIVKESVRLNIHNRSGHLLEGEVSNHPNAKKCGHQFLFTHSQGSGILLPDGRIVSCCQDFGLQYVWGNLLTQSWEEIMDKIHLTELCKKCICGVE